MGLITVQLKFSCFLITRANGEGLDSIQPFNNGWLCMWRFLNWIILLLS